MAEYNNSIRMALLASSLLTMASSALAADVTPQRLLNPDKEPQNWLMNHRTYDGQRFSPLARINRDTVRNLKLAYAVPLGGGAALAWIDLLAALDGRGHSLDRRRDPPGDAIDDDLGHGAARRGDHRHAAGQRPHQPVRHPLPQRRQDEQVAAAQLAGDGGRVAQVTRYLDALVEVQPDPQPLPLAAVAAANLANDEQANGTDAADFVERLE